MNSFSLLYLLGLVLGEGDAELDPLAEAADQGSVVGLGLGLASPHQHDLEDGDQSPVIYLCQSWPEGKLTSFIVFPSNDLVW